MAYVRDRSVPIPPLKEVRIAVDRRPDVRRRQDCDDGNGESGGKTSSAAFIPVAVWTVVAIFGFWIYCQLFPVFFLAVSSYGWWYAVLLSSVPVSLLAYVFFRAFLLFRKLPSFPQVRENDNESYEAKEKLLHGYLEELAEPRSYAASAGFDETQQAEVVRILDSLLGKGSHYSDEAGWLDDFRRFQGLQRARANRVIGNYSKLIGLKTAASPWKFVDIICVFLNSTLMIVDLAKVYNRRMDRGQAFRLVFRWFLNIYISGELGAITSTAADSLGEQLKEPVKESLSNLGWIEGDWAATVAQSMPFVAKFTGKIVEGGVNAFFAVRMGRKAVAAFEPLVSE